MIVQWMRGVLAHRPGRVVGALIGVAVTTTLVSSLGSYLGRSFGVMTLRAADSVPVDWQLLLRASADEAAVRKALAATGTLVGFESVAYADVAKLKAVTGATTQVTGAAKAVGLEPSYTALFPHAFRQLTGRAGGVELAQQTAANLRVRAGDTISIERLSGAPIQVTVDGVVALDSADSFFQDLSGSSVGRIAPPDNVVFMPLAAWSGIFTSQAAGLPATVERQFHAAFNHALLPSDPGAAYVFENGLGLNLRARLSGSVDVGNNLAVRLLAVRADSLYAKVLFLFLGLPGAILALLMTLSIVLSGSNHFLREAALMRIRGATTRQILGYESLEVLLIALGGAVLGAALTYLAARLLTGQAAVFTASNIAWFLASTLGGVVAIGGILMLELWRRLRGSALSSRSTVGSKALPLWRRGYLDLVFLALGLGVYLIAAQSGYQVVMAPEGVPQASVHYEAFLAPFLIWLGGALLGVRLFEAGVGRGGSALEAALRPRSGNLAGVVASSLRRQKRLLSRGAAMIALAFAFAVSTAVFNASYNAQSRVDAELTNGSDVTVTGQTANPVDGALGAIRALPGVVAAEPMMHRFAYVGSDLQDMYGIDPGRIGRATPMSDAFFAGNDAKKTLAQLASRPDGVLVSEETKNDYQLKLGDTLNLRMQFASDSQYHIVPFTFIGVTREFPTAPRDSFLVANASYLSGATGLAGREDILIKTSAHSAAVAAAVRPIVAGIPGAVVTDIGTVQRSIASSLTSMDLAGLTRLELLFSLLFVVGATGLILGLGLNERRRNFAILEALGATSRQLGAFVSGEIGIMFASGAVIGLALGFGIAGVLVKILSGVFDPPPEHLVVPWVYLALLAAAAAAAAIGSSAAMRTVGRRSLVEDLKRL